MTTLKLKTLNSIPKSGEESTPPPLSPKEQWGREKKTLIIKGVCLWLLTHLFYGLLYLLPNPSPQILTFELPVEKDHEVVALQAKLFSQLPAPKTKVRVHLTHDKLPLKIEGYLREGHGDSWDPRYHQVFVEIPAAQISLVDRYDGPWKIFPAVLLKSSSQPSRNVPYEIKI